MLKDRYLDFTVLYQPEEEGGFSVLVPALPGCITQGETLEEARAMAIDAIECYLGSLKLDHEDIPTEAANSVVGKVRIDMEVA